MNDLHNLVDWLLDETWRLAAATLLLCAALGALVFWVIV